MERDYFGKSLKAQLKAANRLQAQTTVILGEEELAKEQAVVRKMEEGLQEVVPLGELVSYLVKGKKEEK